MKLEVKNLQCIRGDKELFSGLSFVLKNNQLMRIEGQNGTGKTTLLRTLCGLYQADQGEVLWNDILIKKQDEEYLKDLFFLGHQNAIKADLNALENLRTNTALEGYEYPDAHTLVVKLSKPHGPLLLAATTPRQLPIMPKHVYGQADDFMKQEAHKNPVGSGPFVVSDRKTDEYISIDRNENHFVEGLPYLDSIIYRNVSDKTAKRIGLRQNQFQLARADSIMRYSDIEEFSKLDHLDLTEYKGISGGAIVLEFNNRKEPLSNMKVRQAIAHAINRTFISDVLHGGYTKPSRSPMPASNVFFNETMQGYTLDLDMANTLLDEAGYPKKDDDMRFELNLIHIAQPFMPDFQPTVEAMNTVF